MDRMGTLPSGLVTFLFTDVEGSSPLWEADEVAMTAATDRHDEIVAATVDEHGGHLLRHKGEGDSTFSVFTRPSDAVACVVDLQRRLAAEPWPTPNPIRVRAAVHTGRAVERENDYLGVTPSRTARLRALADGGQTVVSEATAALVRDRLPAGVRLTERGYHELRGFAHGELVYEVRDDRDAGTVGPGEAPRWPFPRDLLTSGPFVGRGEVLATLESLWQEVADRPGGAGSAFLAGEAGIGKTRLAAELAHRAYEAGARVLYGRCTEHGPPHEPFAQAIDIAHPLEAVDDVEAGRAWLHERYLSALTARAGAAPVVLVLDDLHWAGAGTIELLRLVVTTLVPGLLVVGTYRDTDVPPGSTLAALLADLHRLDPKPARLALEGVDEASVSELLRSELDLPLDDRTRSLAGSIHRETAGNPFYLEEVLGELVERATDPTDALPDGGALPLPESLREVVERRVATLADPVQRVLRTAAVAGPIFDPDVVQVAAGVAEDVLDLLEQAMTRGVVREAGYQFEFVHALTRSVLLAGIPARRLAQMHGLVADALEGRAGVSPLDLARHHEAAVPAGHAPQAARALLDAARDLRLQLDRQGAEEALERAIALSDAHPDVPVRDRIAALTELAISRRDRPESEGTALTREAVRLARQAGDPTLFAWAATRALEGVFLGQVDDELLTMGTEAAAAVEASDPLAAANLRLVSLGHHAWGAPDFRRWPAECEPLVERARALGDRALIGLANQAMVYSLFGSPEVERRLAFTEAGVDHLTGKDQTEMIAWSAVDSLVLGRRDVFEERLRQIERRIQPGSQPYVRVGSVLVARDLLDGRFEPARERATEIFSSSHIDIWPAGLQLIWISYELGESDTVGGLLELARAVRDLPVARAAQATHLAELGDSEPANELFDGMIADDLAAAPRDVYYPLVLAWLAQAAEQLDRRDAVAVLEGELAPFRGQLMRFDMCCGVVGAADRFLGHLARLAGRADEAAACYQTAIEMEDGVASPPLAARSRLCLAEVLADTDPERSAELRAQALAVAETLGMTALARRAATS